jgi:hypothetical protein
MSIDKLAIGVYDFLGYLLPGYVVLIACSIIESTFIGTWFLSLEFIVRSPIAFAAVAYFMGHVAHAVAAGMTKRARRLIQAPTRRLSEPTLSIVKQELNATYGDAIDGANRTNLDVYMLADAYVLASGGGVERDILIAREGFFKQSVAAFALAALVLVIADFRGGVLVQTRPGDVYALGFWPSVLATLSVAGITALFRLRFGFYHRIKIDNTLRLFLALRAKERQHGERRS